MGGRLYDKIYSGMTATTVWINSNVLRFALWEHKIINKFLNVGQGASVLDYGCNTGYIGEYVRRQSGSSVVGVDINPDAVKATQKKGIPAYLATENFHQKHKGSFDAVVLSHVLEHVDKPGALLSNINTLLKKGGTFVVAVPQERIRGDINPLQTLYFFLKGEFSNPHKHNFKERELRQLLHEAGFAPKKHLFVNFIPPFVSLKRSFLRARTLIVCCTKL